MYTLEDYNFDLPEDLIAQYPPEKRGESRLLIVDRKNGSIDSKFSSICDFLNAGDLLVLNDARVVNARVFFRRQSGALVECVLAAVGESPCRILSNRTKKLKIGEILIAQRDPAVSIKITGRYGEFILAEPSEVFDEDCLKKIGVIPLPPYIRRTPDDNDENRYQTVYAQKSGSVAAPTAGLHFTEQIMGNLESKGIQKTFVTLDVSWGTFSPVRSNDLSRHEMHEETYEISDESAAKINHAREQGRRIIAVGTTVVRVLESCTVEGRVVPGCGKTSIFIRPPAQISSVDAMITNFHTPRSTLLMLVSSFAGYERIMREYQEAVAKRYRFFSYGDAMLIV